jgi:Protein of unknown function (DUF1761)
MDLYIPSLQNFVVALIPMVLGMIWFHPKTLGTAWMQGARLTPEDAQGVNMPLLMGVGYAMAFIIGLFLRSYAIFHSGGDGSELTFMHGAFHGVQIGGMVAIPAMISSTLWERKSLNYYLIVATYWFVTFALMGGLLFAWNSGYADIAAKLSH